ncbi:DUF6228 family protein [Streptomyces sp. YIM 130001]|uniref:DUF6228 family protein n=1 Tax=Streptomyces sp. YIM 130001 TaxID=2259644 RepID=UPI001F093DB6|nr:DUF6228 family protein [Streptomyces sp. YIM 130001]
MQFYTTRYGGAASRAREAASQASGALARRRIPGTPRGSLPDGDLAVRDERPVRGPHPAPRTRDGGRRERPDGQVGGSKGGEVFLRCHRLSRTCPEWRGDPIRDFLVTARGQSVHVETTVTTWAGDRPGIFPAEPAEAFRGWTGARTWRAWRAT